MHLTWPNTCMKPQLSPFLYFHSKTRNMWHKKALEEATIATSLRHSFPSILLKMTTIAMLLENDVHKNPIMLKTSEFTKR